MNRFQSILAGINRILSCPKLLTCVGAVLSGYFAIKHASAGMNDDARVALWIGFLGAAAVLLREVINAWTEQDVAAINSTTPVFLPPGTAQAYQDAEAAQASPAAPARGPVDPSKPTSLPGTRASAQRPPVNPNMMSSAPRLPTRMPPRTVLPSQQSQ